MKNLDYFSTANNIKKTLSGQMLLPSIATVSLQDSIIMKAIIPSCMISNMSQALKSQFKALSI